MLTVISREQRKPSERLETPTINMKSPLAINFYNFFITVRNEVAKVMFLQVCVCPRRGGGGYPSMDCRWYPSMPCSRSLGGRGGIQAHTQGGSLGRSVQVGCLLGGGWPSVVVFCYALQLWPSGLVAFLLKVAFWFGLGGAEGHNRRPPHQKALPEAHTRRPLSTRRLPSIRRPPNPEGHNRRPQQKAMTEGYTPTQPPK